MEQNQTAAMLSTNANDWAMQRDDARGLRLV